METPNKKNVMLVPTDFSDVATNALGHAISIAKTFDNEIALLYINDAGSMISSIFSGNDQNKLINEAILVRLNTIKENTLKEHGIVVHTVIRESRNIYKTIVETADELGCDSIVMGTHGANGIKQIIGSNSSRVISHADVPVIVVKEKSFGEGYKNIVFPVDLTFETRQKVRWAIHLAKKFNSTIHILSFHESDEFLSHKINANIKKVEEQFQEAGVKYTSYFRPDKSSFAKETISYAENTKADLIMIMTQQEEGIAEFIIGSYAQQIVNQSTIPVMTVTPTTKGITEVVRAY
jgi:nucleotide-binding universal stress UspA family protein